MTSFFVKIYDYLSQHKALCWSTLLVLLVLFAVAISQLSYKEDITDFIAVDEQYKTNMAAYRESNLTNRTLVLFDYTFPSSASDSCGITPSSQDSLMEAVDAFYEELAALDTTHILRSMVPSIDFTQFDSMLVNLYANAPYLLQEQDYVLMDSLLAQPGYIAEQLADRRAQLLFSVSPILTEQMMHDPLALFTPIWQRLVNYQPQSSFDWSSGYIFTPDGHKIITYVESNFTDTDTQANQALAQLLESAKSQTSLPESVQVRFIGSAMIAMANAHQVNHDAIWAISISLVLIIVLLLVSFQRSQPMFLILLSTAFGYAFALALISLFRDQVSLIVLGISSMMVGIAVNYPLHYLFHLKYEPHPRKTLQDLAAPLLIGNITTVGAFLTLVPLQAVALQDLGWFCAFMLVGTILFVMIFLPQFPQVSFSHSSTTPATHKLWTRLERLPHNPYLLGTIGVLTLVFAFFSWKTEFDPNIAHLNYMTPEQKEDIQYLSQFSHQDAQSDVLYLLTAPLPERMASEEPNSYEEMLFFQEAETEFQLRQLEALAPVFDSLQRVYPQIEVRVAADFYPSQASQAERLQCWNAFVARHPELMGKQWEEQVQKAGFAPHAFSAFSNNFQLRTQPFMPKEDQAFLQHTLLQPYFTSVGVMGQLSVPHELTPQVKQLLQEKMQQTSPASTVFDMQAMHEEIASSLSDNFNYIGWACAILVFAFLWFSFRRIELAIVAFIPMVVGWIWITGIMYLLGIQFNLVNIILASFIFGQGDDYTIFVTEGLIQEHKTGKGSQWSYKLSIVLSASIMLVGMGTLIIAQHPAMFSLAQVSIVGMLVVVLMSWLLPPVLLRFMLQISPSLRQSLAPDSH